MGNPLASGVWDVCKMKVWHARRVQMLGPSWQEHAAWGHILFFGMGLHEAAKCMQWLDTSDAASKVAAEAQCCNLLIAAHADNCNAHRAVRFSLTAMSGANLHTMCVWHILRGKRAGTCQHCKERDSGNQCNWTVLSIQVEHRQSLFSCLLNVWLQSVADDAGCTDNIASV